MKLFLIALILSPFLSIGQPYLLVLGTAQDGGHPHIGCKKSCCEQVLNGSSEGHYVVSLALVDPEDNKWWLFEATPDFKEQLQYFRELTRGAYSYLPEGIFLTHAHMGHYTGLAQLGREALGAKGVKVYTLPKLKHFLETNGPWSQLVKLNNINIEQLSANSIKGLNRNIKVKAFTVPHRDEYSETAGFSIITPEKKYLFIPDINKWSKWEQEISKEIDKVDYALVDATFYDEAELPGRRMEEVPHPFVQETIELLSNKPDALKAKVYFIHMNHTNPLLWNKAVQKKVRSQGFNYALQGMTL